MTAQQMMEQILKLVGSSKTLMFAVLGIALAVAVLGVLNTVLMSVMEKLREFGYMRCVGASPGYFQNRTDRDRHALRARWRRGGHRWRARLVGRRLPNPQVLPYVPDGKLVAFDAPMLVLTPLITVGIGALAGVYPSWKASHASPMEAIRNE